MGSDQHYSLRWNDYTVKIVTAFQSLRDEEDFVDVTVACDGHSYSAHKMVLSACSPYFRVLLRANPCQHPIVILKDVGHSEMERLLEFMYNGEVSIAQDQLAAFLKTAENLKIRGLAGNSDDMEQFQRADISYNYNSRCSMGGGGTSGRSSPSVSYAPSQASKDDELTTDVPSGYLSRNPDSPPSKRRKRSSAPAASHSDANAASHSKDCVVSESGAEVSGSSASDGCGIVGAPGSGPNNDSDDPRQECRELKTEPQDPILDVYAEGPDLGSDPQGQHQSLDPLDTRSSVMYPLAMPGPSGTLGGQDTSQEPGDAHIGKKVEEDFKMEQHEVFGDIDQSFANIEEDLPFAGPHTFSQGLQETFQNNHSPFDDNWIPHEITAGQENWTENFEVPWTKMPPTLMKAVQEGKRPDPSDRRLFIRMIVDEMHKHCPNPLKKECELIVKAIVLENANSFGDFSEEGEMIGSGYESLLKQIKARIENLNRNSSRGRLSLSFNCFDEGLPYAEHTFSHGIQDSSQDNFVTLRDNWTHEKTGQKNYTQSQNKNTTESPSLPVIWQTPEVNIVPLSSTFPSASVSATPHFSQSLNKNPNWLNWADNFEIPWAKMPAALVKSVHEGKRPDPPNRRIFIRIVVDEMRQLCPNPTKRACEVIVKAIIQAHPNSFADFSDEGEFVGSGHHSLLRQIKARIENLNRNCTYGRLRAKRISKPDDSENQELGLLQLKKIQSPADSYGCVNWQPITLPEKETEETLESKCVYMVELYSREGYSGADKNLIDELMKVTYYSQRCTINANPTPSISEIITKWPFLSFQKYMDEHFKELTKIPLYSRLLDTMTRKSTRIMKYFRGLQNLKPATQEVIEEIDVAVSEDVVIAPGVILLLMTHFQEKTDSIFLLADESATKEDIGCLLELPETPRLIVQGNSILNGVKWMLSIERKVICELTSSDANFVMGLALLFASYYNFNQQYEEGAAETLEFIQRYLVGINPDTGTKCVQYTAISKITGKRVMRRREPINPNVLTLMNRINSIEL